MKKLIVGLILPIALAYGKPIDETTAKTIGQSFLIQKTALGKSSSAPGMQLVHREISKLPNLSASAQPATLFYVFNTGANGFVVTAGDDNVEPILAYSDKKSFDPENIPPNAAKWFEGYKNEIRHIIKNQIQASNQISNNWEILRKGTAENTLAKAAPVLPLMQTQWNQSPFYNAQCPRNSVSGCVATAMTQIMKYWNYPANGSGFHSYNHSTYGTLSANFGSTAYQWSSMPNVLTSANNAVATLTYHAGVSVDMNYSPSSSGAYVISAQNPVSAEHALKTYFGYKSTLRGVQKTNYTQAAWVTLLKTELDASRPILYAGFGTGGGHAFVCDGYDANDFFHFNWGWGGSYDGYFFVGALNPSGTGTGGGTGGYNSGNQAVIGIEPPAGVQTFSLELYNSVTPNSTVINYGSAFTITTNIRNGGTGPFTGDYCAALFDSSLSFVDYVEIKTGQSLPGGFAYNNNLVFSDSGSVSLLPQTYYVGIYFKPTGGNWSQVANSGSYTNLTPITVVNPNAMELNAPITVSPGTTLIRGQPASVNLNLVNNGTATFTGKYAVALYDLEGSLVQVIDTVSETSGLQSGFTYLSPFLTFSTIFVLPEPGTYLMAVIHIPDGTGTAELTGSTATFKNPIKVTIQAPVIQPDQYESNNSIGTAFNLPSAFSGNPISISSTGSNCHSDSDYDYFKVRFPANYNYKVASRLHDSYSSTNGNTYTLDALFSYSRDSVTWSDAYDDTIPDSIAVNGGSTLFFHVAPYFPGGTGSYLLDLGITRTTANGIFAGRITKSISIYPNPAKSFINVDLNDFKDRISKIQVLNIQGKQQFSVSPDPSKRSLRLPLTNISEGTYFMQIKTDNGVVSKKIKVEK